MITVDNLSNAAFQQVQLQMPDGSAGQLTVYYRAAASRWFFDFVHAQFPTGSLLGSGLCVHPNLLRQFKNFLNFGMACVTGSGLDPITVNDFASGYATLYILDASDVAQVEKSYFGVLT